MAIINIKGYEVLIDDEDLAMITGKICIAMHGKYAQLWHKTKVVYLHRFIMKPEDGMHVDHINNNGLDNRRENLRICNRSQNMANSKKRSNNTSGYKGVMWEPRRNRWRAKIRKENKTRFLGYFSTAIEAYQAYCKAAKEIHGEFARLA